MDTSARQAFLSAAERQARVPSYWLGEAGEFAMFDVGAAYLSGNARIAIERVLEHIASITKARSGHSISAASLAQSESLPSEIKDGFTRLSKQNQNGPFTEPEAQNAVRCFYHVLFGRAGG